MFTRNLTQIDLTIDGVAQTPFTSSATDSYFLAFDLQGNNTLQIQNLSVVRGATTPPPPPTMTLTPATNTVSIVQGSSGSVDLTLNSQNGMTGNPTLQLYCMKHAQRISATVIRAARRRICLPTVAFQFTWFSVPTPAPHLAPTTSSIGLHFPDGYCRRILR